LHVNLHQSLDQGWSISDVTDDSLRIVHPWEDRRHWRIEREQRPRPIAATGDITPNPVAKTETIVPGRAGLVELLMVPS
jgi:hypothetical protein